MATKKNTNEETITIRPIELKTAKIRIVGDSPLIVHAWSAKARKEMLAKQMGTSKTQKKMPKDPVADFIDSMYWLTPKPEEATVEAFEEAVANGARFGFKAAAFKAAGNSSAYRNGWVKNQTALRESYFIVPDQDDLVEIHAEEIVMREDPVKISTTSDLRYRGEFRNWWADLTVSYNANGQFTLDDLINVLNVGGFGCGVGEWRPEKDGQFGRYHVEAIS